MPVLLLEDGLTRDELLAWIENGMPAPLKQAEALAHHIGLCHCGGYVEAMVVGRRASEGPRGIWMDELQRTTGFRCLGRGDGAKPCGFLNRTRWSTLVDLPKFVLNPREPGQSAITRSFPDAPCENCGNAKLLSYWRGRPVGGRLGVRISDWQCRSCQYWSL